MELKWFEYLIGLLGAFTPFQQLVMVVFIAPLLFITYRLIVNKEFRKDFFNMIKGFKTETVYDVSDHEIFLTKAIFNQNIQNITFNKKIKDDIFKIILHTKINIVIDELKKFTNKNINDNDNIDKDMFEFLEVVEDKYEKKIKSEMLKKFKEDADFLYLKIYEDNFKQYHSSNITYILKAVKQFAQSRLNNNQKVYTFLTLSYVSLDMSIIECERYFDSLNGDLDEYNNKWYK